MANLLGTTVNGSLLIGPSGADTAYGGAATGKLYFGNQVSDSPTNYHITTNMENYNGDYSKLDIRWYTGQRFYAHTGYGGFRFHEITTNAELFSVGKGDAHVRVDNNLYVGNTIYNNGNAVIHAGNIGSQSVSYAATAGSAPANGGTSTHTYRGIIEDTRAGQRTPNDYEDYRVSWEFTNQMPHDSNWLTIMTMQGWHNGYASWQIMGTATTSALENWYLRSGVNGTWNTARTIIHSGNIGSQSVDTATNAYKLLASSNKQHYLGTSSNWDNVGFGSLTNLHFQGHNQFWVGAGNAYWWSGGIVTEHDLLISTMEGYNTDAYFRGITFAVDVNANGSSGGYRLGRWQTYNTDWKTSRLQVDASLSVGYGNRTNRSYNEAKYPLDRGVWDHGRDNDGYGDDRIRDLLFSPTANGGGPWGCFASLEVSSVLDGNNDVPALFRIHQWGSGAAEFWKPQGSTLYLRESPGGGGSWFTRLEVQGNQSITGALDVNSISDRAYARITNPGSAYSINNGPQSGSVKIKLPTAASYTNSMMSFTVQIYNYSTGTSRTIRCGGYTYFTTDWYNVFAYQVGDNSAGDLNVRFGKDSSGACVWIGETNTSWSYPNIFVTDVQSGHSQPSAMQQGWSVSIVTSFDTVLTSRTAYAQINSGNIADQEVASANRSSSASTLDNNSTISGLNFGGVLALTASGANTSNSTGARLTESYGPQWNLSNSATWHYQILNGSLLVGISAAGANFGGGNYYGTGDVTAYYSDERLKTKVSVITNAIEKIKSLEGFIYVENDLARSFGYSNENEQAGVSAQQIQKVLPQAVSLAPFDMQGVAETGEIISKSGNEYLTVKYDRIVPLLIEGIKEQQKQIDELKAKLDGLTK